MQRDIKNCTVQYLKNVFAPLNEYKDYVFWIRNHDMSRQIYVSAVYETIWSREEAILYEIPLIWLDYLAKKDNTIFMKKMQDRHICEYKDPQKNLLLYQIDTPQQKTQHLRDECFRCESQTGEIYIVGVSKRLPEMLWISQSRSSVISLDDSDKVIYEQLFKLLLQHFGIKRKSNIVLSSAESLRLELVNTHKIKFSKRELECLYHLCKGKTAKQTASIMQLSPRTVETHLENIRNKAKCGNKLEVIGRYARIFTHVDNLYSQDIRNLTEV